MAETAYTSFFLNSPGRIIQYDCIEISHSAFTKIYRVVRNNTDGITVTHEDSNSYDYTYYPLKISSLGARGDLDQGLQIILGDLGEVLPKELDSVSMADGFAEKPVVNYRTYRSDNLSVPLYGPLRLEVTTFSFTRKDSSFEAKAPLLNINKTGELFEIDRFPMLRGLL